MDTATLLQGRDECCLNQQSVSVECPRKRLYWLDAMKGWAIVLVVAAHSGMISGSLGWFLTAGYMQLFFIVSGYTYRDVPGGIKKRWSKLIRPYIFWHIVYLCCSFIFHWMSNTLSARRAVLDIVGVFYSRWTCYVSETPGNERLVSLGSGPLWFISCMLLSYCLFIPLIRATGRKLIILVAVYLLISFAFTFTNILMPWSLDTAFLGALFIRLGYYFKNIVMTRKQIAMMGGVAVCACLLLCYYFGEGIGMWGREYGPYGRWCIGSFFLIGVFYTLACGCFFGLLENTFITRFFAVFGKISLYIMCAHMFFEGIFEIVLLKLSGMGLVSDWVFSPLNFTLTLASCWISYQVLKLLARYTKSILTWTGC